MRYAIWFVFAALACRPGAFAAELRVGRTNAAPGAIVSVPVVYNGPAGVAVQFDVSLNSSAVNIVGIAAGEALSGHVVDWQPLGPGHWRVLAYSPTNGAFASGPIARLNLAVASDAADGIVPLAVGNVVIAKASGDPVWPLAAADGGLSVSSAETIESIALLDGTHARLTITGIAGRVFALQGSPDLFHWADLGRHTNDTGLLTLTTTRPAGRDAYFYRAAQEPATNRPAVPAPSLGGARVLADGRMVFEAHAIAGSAWRVEGSPDLFHWGNYGVVTNFSGAQSITNRPFGQPRPAVYFHRLAQP